jgi:PAS domain S-box-containing protein/putative nucleotidyltransferase with HDIG domain
VRIVVGVQRPTTEVICVREDGDLVRVLLVEDNPGDATLVQTFLNDDPDASRFRITVCERLTQALELAQDDATDLVLLDLGLPDSQGLETFKVMHDRHPGLPIIVLTGSDDVALGIAAIQSGATDFLAKGRIDSDLLPRAIRYALARGLAETSLRKSEERYRRMYEGSLAGVYSASLDGRVHDCNEAFASLLGYASLEDVRAIPAGQIYAQPEDRDRLVTRLQAQGGITNYETRLRRRDGSAVWVIENARLVEPETPAPPMIEGTVIEIARRRLLGDVLRILNRPNEWTALMRDILRTIKEATGIQAAGIRLNRADRYGLTIAEGFDCAGGDDRGGDRTGTSIVEESGKSCRDCLCGEVLREHTDSALPFFTAEGSFWTNAFTDLFSGDSRSPLVKSLQSDCCTFDYESLALIPIRSSDTVIGLLQLGDRRRNAFDPDLVRFLEDLAGTLGVAYRRQVSEERIRGLLARQTRINQLTLELGKTLDLQQTYRAVYQHIHALIDADAFLISLFDRDQEMIRAAYAVTRNVVRDPSSFPAIPLEPQGRGTQSHVIRTGEPLLVGDWQKAMRETSKHYRIYEEGTIVEGPATPDSEDDPDVTRSALLAPMMVEGAVLGVLQVQSHRHDAYKDEDLRLLAGLANVAGAAIRNAQLIGVIEDDARRLRSTLDGTIRALSRATETRDPYTAGHQRRVTELACAIAEHLDLNSETVEALRMAGLLHDIGKMSVPAEILVKPSRLTPIEFSMLKAHPEVGFDILKSAEMPWQVAEIVLQHHERMDGSGYPRGIQGDAIMLEARILCVSDVVEAMSSHRPYRPSLGTDAGVGEISTNAGTLYDRRVVQACRALFEGGFQWAEESS